MLRPRVFRAQPEFSPRPSVKYSKWDRSRCPSRCPPGHPHEPQSRTPERYMRDGARPPNELQLGFFARQLMASWMFLDFEISFYVTETTLKKQQQRPNLYMRIGLAPPQGAKPTAQTKIRSITAFFCSSV